MPQRYRKANKKTLFKAVFDFFSTFRGMATIRTHIFKALSAISYLAMGLAMYAQTGKPVISNYKNNHFQIDFTVHDIGQDEQGILYFATSKGLISYNGSQWTKINEAGNKPIFEILIDSNRIYLTGGPVFGYLQKTGNSFYYFSMADSAEKRGFNSMISHRLVKVKNEVYFVGTHTLICSTNNRNTYLEMPDTSVAAIAYQKNLLVHIPNKGFYELKNKQEWVYLPLNHKEDKNLIKIKSSEGYLCLIYQDGQIDLLDKSGQWLSGLNTPIKNIKDVELISQEHLAICSDQGVVFYNILENTIDFILSKDDGLESHVIQSLFMDNQKNLWVGTDKGISKIELYLPFSFYSEESKLPGSVNDLIISGQKMYVATYDGIYIKDYHTKTRKPEFFKRLASSGKSITDLEWLDGTLLAVAKNQIQYLPKDGLILEDLDAFSTTAKIEKLNHHEFIAYTQDEIRLYKKCHDLECKIFPWKGISIIQMPIQQAKVLDSLHIAILSDQTLYLYSIKSQLTTKLSPHKIQDIFTLKNHLLVQSDSGLIQVSWKAKIPRLKKYFDINQDPFVSNYTSSFLIQTPYFHYLVFSSEKSPIQAFYHSTTEDTRKFVPMSLFKRLPSLLIHNIITDPYTPGNFWACTENGLIEFLSSPNPSTQGNFSTILSSINVQNKSVTGAQNLLIPYKKNSISFEFSCTNYIVEEFNEYSYILEGPQPSTWSTWSTEKKVTFASLEAGQYTFKVKSKNLYQQQSNICSYSFTIVTPWYQTFWMYILYAILLATGVYIIVKIYTQRLKISNQKLQQLINVRTDEIRKQKEVIEEKNKSITSSIEYARTIQEAILTSKDYLQAILQEYFILYTPRDIIGGDFYWGYQSSGSGKIILAVADCTGHGVPGALMSMIGYSLLNEIVIENKVEDPNLILDQLRNGIINSFQQTNTAKVERSHDGMDISLICLDQYKKVMHYASAKQIILVIRNAEVIELETDFQPVSNFIANLQPYKNHTYNLQKGDVIYLFSDGFPDQFGGDKGKKYMLKRFKSFLLDIHTQPMKEQEKLLKKDLEQWRGSQEQVDDICVMGIRI